MIDNNQQTKESWSTPKLVIYGDIEQLTLQSKLKQPGSSDDFGVTGVSDFP
jgi:hypothetical protein